MSEAPKRRKKVCPHCGRKLWLRDFYPIRKTGGYSSWCKDCQKQNKREWYDKNHRVPDGIKQDQRTGRLYEHKGLSRRIYWNTRMVDDMKRLYATTKNEDLADIVGVSQRTLIRKARELGLEKDPAWQHGNTMRHLKMAKLTNDIRGIKSPFEKGRHYCPENEFKPGHKESEETKAKRIASYKDWCRKHPAELRERARKVSETRKRNKLIRQNEQQQTQGQQ